MSTIKPISLFLTVAVKGETQAFSLPRFTSSERTYPRRRNLRFIDEVAWFRLEGAPSNPKGKEDKLALFTTTLHKGTITSRDSRRDISIDRVDVIPWTSRRDDGNDDAPDRQ